MSYAKKAVTGIGWMFTSSASVQGIGLVANMVLARLLMPADFGAVALVVAIIAVLQTFAELGMSVALIQREHVTRSLIDSAFTATVLLTLSIAAIIWVISPHVASFFRITVLSGLLKIAALSYLFSGIFSLHRCLLLRNLRYREISIIGFGAVVLSSVTSIVLAYQGHGPYSIVWGHFLSGAGCLVAGLWLTKYLPGSFGSFRDMRSLFSFGMWVSLGRIMGNAAGKVDSFVIGRALDAATLGGYYLAQKIVLLIPNTYTGIIDQVMLPIYSKFQKEADRIQDGYFKTLSLTAIILLPPICLIFTFADPLVRILLGGRWLQVIPLVMIMSLFGIAQSLGGGVFASVIYSLGRPQLATVINAFRMAALPGFVLVGSLWGVLGVAWGFALYCVIGRLFSQWLLRHFFGFSFLRYLKTILPVSISASAATAPAYCIRYFFAHGSLCDMVFWNLTALIVWVLIYFLFIRTVARKEIEYLLGIGKPIFQTSFVYRGLLYLQRRLGFI
ncbi:MAG TPA: lipopolysaccharide biosynthesis protein [Smithellaceae bacterium]|nr:lipopolysaccharide biosynthesis protein [Smithellaceae bacterium]